MTTTMDSAGRVTIPQTIRRLAGLKAGTVLDVRCRGGVVEIESQALRVKLKREAGFVVARPLKSVPALKASTVERVRQRLLKDRGAV